MSYFTTSPSTATKTLRVLAHLLSYPDAELRAHLPELEAALHQRMSRGGSLGSPESGGPSG